VVVVVIALEKCEIKAEYDEEIGVRAQRRVRLPAIALDAMLVDYLSVQHSLVAFRHDPTPLPSLD